MTKIKIGDKVITRNYDSKCCISCDDKVNSFADKEGIVTAITKDGMYLVHDLLWPSESVELVQWQPEYGKEYEFSKQSNFASYRTMKFVAKDGDNFVGRSIEDNCYYGYLFIRPIRRTLEDELKDWVKKSTYTSIEQAVQELMSIIANYQPDVTDEEIYDYFVEFDGNQRLSIIATVRHFIKQRI